MIIPGIFKSAAPYSLSKAFSPLKSWLFSGPAKNELISEVMLRSGRSQIKPALMKSLNQGRITKQQFSDTLWKLRGTKLKEWGINSGKDILHPIDNIKKTLLHTIYDIKPVNTNGRLTPQLVRKSRTGLLGSSAMSIGLPAAFAVPPLLEKNEPMPGRIARSAAYATIPFTFRRFVPSIGAFMLVDHLLPRGNAHNTA